MTEEMLELLRLLEQHGVRYLVVGGIAVNLHGYNRLTKDIDLWFADEQENRALLYEALREYFENDAPIERNYFFSHKGVFILGFVPNRIDLLMEAEGPEFSEAFANRIRAREGDLEFNLVALQDLLEMKRAANRPQDRADIAELGDSGLLNSRQNGDAEAEKD